METEAQGGKNLRNASATHSNSLRQTDALSKTRFILNADWHYGEVYLGEKAALLVKRAQPLKQPDLVSFFLFFSSKILSQISLFMIK